MNCFAGTAGLRLFDRFSVILVDEFPVKLWRCDHSFGVWCMIALAFDLLDKSIEHHLNKCGNRLYDDVTTREQYILYFMLY